MYAIRFNDQGISASSASNGNALVNSLKWLIFLLNRRVPDTSACLPQVLLKLFVCFCSENLYYEDSPSFINTSQITVGNISPRTFPPVPTSEQVKYVPGYLMVFVGLGLQSQHTVSIEFPGNHGKCHT